MRGGRQCVYNTNHERRQAEKILQLALGQKVLCLPGETWRAVAVCGWRRLHE